MANLIAIVILIISVLGIVLIFYKKLPLLNEVQLVKKESKSKKFVKEIRKKVKENFSYDDILQRFFSRIRIFVLKIERKVDIILQHLRKKTKEEKDKKE